MNPTPHWMRMELQENRCHPSEVRRHLIAWCVTPHTYSTFLVLDFAATFLGSGIVLSLRGKTGALSVPDFCFLRKPERKVSHNLFREVSFEG